MTNPQNAEFDPKQEQKTIAQIRRAKKLKSWLLSATGTSFSAICFFELLSYYHYTMTARCSIFFSFATFRFKAKVARLTEASLVPWPGPGASRGREPCCCPVLNSLVKT